MRSWNFDSGTRSAIFDTPKTAKMGRFCRFGGTKNGTLGARIKIPRPHLEIQTTPKTPIQIKKCKKKLIQNLISQWKIGDQFRFSKLFQILAQKNRSSPLNFSPFFHKKWHFGCPNQNFETTFRDTNHPQNPHFDTLGTFFGPRKVIFGHFVNFAYFYLIFPLARAVFFKCKWTTEGVLKSKS